MNVSACNRIDGTVAELKKGKVYRYFKPPFPRSARAAGTREAVNRAVFGDNPPLSMTIHLLTPALN